VFFTAAEIRDHIAANLPKCPKKHHVIILQRVAERDWGDAIYNLVADGFFWFKYQFCAAAA
jgi:hypothetical protein